MEKAAADFLEQNHGPITEMLIEVSGDLADELAGLGVGQRDARLAAEMAYRMDRAIDFPNVLAEALDWFGFFLASLAIIGVVRALERTAERKGKRLAGLKKKLADRGPKMVQARKRSIVRRIARLEKDLT
jgi:hypothetical protein